MLKIKKYLLLLSVTCFCNPTFANVDLLQVFQDALSNDPTYQKANAQRLSIHENVPIARSYLLPQLTTSGYSLYNILNSRTGTTFTLNGKLVTFGQGTFKYNANGYNLNLSQNIFNYQEWASLQEAKISARAADAAYMAAFLDLMSRTAQAYFNVLSAQDTLRYIQAEKKAIYQQLDQVTQQYKVGVVAITGVYQSQAAYDSIISQEIAASTNVINQRENLQAITGIYYTDLAGLKSDLPLIPPIPSDPDIWVKRATELNWSLIAAKLAADAAKEDITVQFAGHFPVVQAVAEQTYAKTGVTPSGVIDTTLNSVGVQFNFPVFQGGLVVAETKQAEYNYEAAVDNTTQTYRQVYNDTEQSYNFVISYMSQVKADRQAIISNASSLRSTMEAFKVGTETMLDVLNSQQDLYNAESKFSTDQYRYINSTISLKKAAGILCIEDLIKINDMLTHKKDEYSSLSIDKIQKQANESFKNNYNDPKLADKILNAGANVANPFLNNDQSAIEEIPPRSVNLSKIDTEKVKT